MSAITGAMNAFLQQLDSRPLLGDGAMGTMLYARDVPVTQCLEALNVERPALVQSIHEAYARAGADILTTHSFGANRMRLAVHELADQVRALNLAAVTLARQAAFASGNTCFIAGNVGPVGKRVQWDDAGDAADTAAALREQITVLAAAGVDLLLFETFSDVEEIVLAVDLARACCALPLVASVSYGANGLTLAGQDVATVTRRLVEAGAEVVGANCSVGPTQMVETLHVMRAVAPDARLSVTPNAGLPTQAADGGLEYPVGPHEFAGYVPAYLAAGASIIGGCCGTTPAHVAALRAEM